MEKVEERRREERRQADLRERQVQSVDAIFHLQEMVEAQTSQVNALRE